METRAAEQSVVTFITSGLYLYNENCMIYIRYCTVYKPPQKTVTQVEGEKQMKGRGSWGSRDKQD